MSAMCILSGASALTAKETSKRSLEEINQLHTTRTKAADASRID
ncbi:hypothetical protein [Arthrobacter sp. JSM 101049]